MSPNEQGKGDQLHGDKKTWLEQLAPEGKGEVERLAGFIAMEMGEKGASCEQIADLVLRLGYSKQAQEASKISPHKLYEMAKGDSEEYKRLCIKHGYLIPKQTVLNRDELIKILESMNIVNGTILMKNVCDQADWIISVATSPDRVMDVKWPEKKIEGKHKGHYFDENYCYNCQDIVDDDDPDPTGTNYKWNDAIDACKRAVASAQGLIPLDEEKLKRWLGEFFDEMGYDVSVYGHKNLAHNITNKFATKAPEVPTKKEIHDTVQKVILDFQVNEVSLSGKYLKDDPKCLVDMLTDAISLLTTGRGGKNG